MTPFHFKELIKKGYNLDLVYMLKLIEKQFDIIPLCKGSMRITALYQGLIRKGLITEDNKISEIGKEILRFIEAKEFTKLIKKKPRTTEFETWWKVFPGTDTFKYKGQIFNGSRSLRTRKFDCKIKFEKILNEGEYTAKEIIAALIFDVRQKKENSVMAKANKLKYLQNSLTYLNQRSFEPFIELLKENIIIKEYSEIFKGTDI